MTEHYIKCPVCKAQIPFEIHQLLNGMQYTCPNCKVKVGLSRESKPTADKALNKSEDLKKIQSGNK